MFDGALPDLAWILSPILASLQLLKKRGDGWSPKAAKAMLKAVRRIGTMRKSHPAKKAPK